jgi:DNA-binding LacI/PurR family transcriptional regulator
MSSGVRPKRVTLSDVAELAGVSVMTASYTYGRPERVSPAMRERVLEAARSIGYAGPDPSARSLRRGSTLTLGVVLGEQLTYAFDDPQAVQFLAGIAEVCAERGFGLTILPVTGTDDDRERITAAAVDSFVVWTTAATPTVLAAIRATKRRAVIHSGPPIEGFTVVGIDDRAAAKAIGTVAFTSSRRPAVLSFPLDHNRSSFIASGVDPADAAFPVTRDRLEGYRDAAREIGIPWEQVRVGVCSVNSATEAESVAAELLASDPAIDAIAAMSDQLALGILRVAANHERAVPADLAVTGWDDSPIAAESKLTTISQSLRDQGALCAATALGDERESDGGEWQLVVRETTRA